MPYIRYMNMFDKLFVASYKYFAKRDKITERFSAIVAISAIQMCVVFIPIILVKTIFQSTILSSLHSKSKIIGIVMSVPWCFINYYYYDKVKIEKLLKDYDEMPEKRKAFWNWSPLAVMIFFISVFCCAVYLNKYLKQGI